MSLRFKVCMTLVVIASAFIVSAQLVCRLLTLLLPGKVKRGCQSLLERIWVETVGCLMNPTKLVLTGDVPDPAEPAIFICNHQMDADWWFMWVLAKHYGRHGHLKIILKHALKWVPVLGWGMQSFDFIFIHRDLKRDAPILDRKVRGFLQDAFPFWILLFPEGTTVHAECIEKSHEFAKKQGRPVLSKTVLPRVNGFASVLNAMPDTLKVYDCTMVYSAYTGDVPDWNDGYTRKKDKDVPNLFQMFNGKQTPPTYLHITEFQAAEIKKQGIEAWLDERWVEKDTILTHYATSGQMPEKIVGTKKVEISDAGSLSGFVWLVSLHIVVWALAGWAWYSRG